MNQRICKFIGFNEVNCGTFHSLGLRLLRKYDYLFHTPFRCDMHFNRFTNDANLI